MSDFGKRLQEARKSLGLGVAEMSERLGLEKNSYYKYEDGSRFPRPEVLSDLVEKLDIDVNWLLTGHGEMFIGAPGKKKPHLNDVFPGVPADRDTLDLIASLEVPIMRSSLLVTFLECRKRYEDFIEEHFRRKEKRDREQENEGIGG